MMTTDETSTCERCEREHDRGDLFWCHGDLCCDDCVSDAEYASINAPIVTLPRHDTLYPRLPAGGADFSRPIILTADTPVLAISERDRLGLMAVVLPSTPDDVLMHWATHDA